MNEIEHARMMVWSYETDKTRIEMDARVQSSLRRANELEETPVWHRPMDDLRDDLNIFANHRDQRLRWQDGKAIGIWEDHFDEFVSWANERYPETAPTEPMSP